MNDPTPINLRDIHLDPATLNRKETGMAQLDNPLGGGLVSGSIVLIGGDPGVGKSTLGIAACGAFARDGATVLYTTGEESLQQVRMRADRTGVNPDHLLLSSCTDVCDDDDDDEGALSDLVSTAICVDPPPLILP